MHTFMWVWLWVCMLGGTSLSANSRTKEGLGMSYNTVVRLPSILLQRAGPAQAH
jgi:hypothetical protein